MPKNSVKSNQMQSWKKNIGINLHENQQNSKNWDEYFNMQELDNEFT